MRYALLLSIVTACSFPLLDNSASDANGSSDGNSDDGSNGGTDASIDAPGIQCDASSTYASPTLVDQTADHYLSSTTPPPEELQFAGRMTNETAPDFLFIDLFPPNSGGIVTGTFTLKPTDNFGNCDVCVLVLASCNNCNPFDTQGTGEYYMATGGTLKVTSVTNRLTGTLMNATFTHVKIDNAGTNPTYVSTPLNDGCNSAVVSTSFNVAIQIHINGSLSRSRRLAK